ncbi:MAG: GFA family protein [Planctomycetota bacterium]
MHKGSCLCGAVRFEVRGTLRPPDACHCIQCRKQSGHYWTSTDVPREAVTIHGEDRVTWFDSAPPRVRRGFCSVCGASLFWERTQQKGPLAIAMGAFDGPTDVALGKHIFVAEKGDYYQLTDGLPQHER